MSTPGFKPIGSAPLVLSGAGTTPDPVNTLTLDLVANAAGGKTWHLPASNGTANQALVTDGASPATLTWASAGTLLHAVLYDPASDATQVIQPANNTTHPLQLKQFGSSSLDLFKILASGGGTLLVTDYQGATQINSTSTTATPLQVNGIAGAIDLFNVFHNGVEVFDVPIASNPVVARYGYDTGSGVGYMIAGAAPSGHYLRGNGTRYVDSAILVGDLPSLISTDAVVTDPANSNKNLIKPTADAVALRLQNYNNAATSYLLTGEKDNGAGVATTFSLDKNGDVVADALTLTTPLVVSSGGTGAATITDKGIVIAHGTSALTATTLTNGQLLIGSTGNAPVAATLASADASVTITNSAGGIDLSAAPSGIKVYTSGATIAVQGAIDGSFTTDNNGLQFIPTEWVLNTQNIVGGGVSGKLSAGITAPNYIDYLAASTCAGSTHSSRVYPAPSGADTNTIAPGTTVTLHIAVAATFATQDVEVIVRGYERAP